MRAICCLAVLVLVLPTSLVAREAPQEQPVNAPIESVAMFKNGLAMVRRTVQIPAAGVYRIDDLLRPVHGTFSIESQVPVSVQTTYREVEVQPSAAVLADVQQALVGREVTIHFRDGLPSASGKVLALEEARGEHPWNRIYEIERYAYQRVPAQRRFLLLQNGQDRMLVDASLVVYLSIKDGDAPLRQRRQVLLLHVEEALAEPTTITISYLSKGISWAPDYRVNLQTPGRLTIEQRAVIKNELADLEDAELRLVSGFPAMPFAHVTSPLALDTNWATFFQQLNQDPRRMHAAASNVMRQVTVVREPGTEAGMDLSPSAEGVDLHYQSVGRRTLAEGDALALSVAEASTDYERIVEWIVPDTRTVDGRYIDQHVREQNPDKYEDAAWDAVRFRNPLAFPMTTAPAVITTGERFAGQQMATWTNRGEETTLRITKALSLRTRAAEHEEQAANREFLYLGGRRFAQVQVRGELSIHNHRNEPVNLVIRRQFSGDLKQADAEPTLSLREEGAWSVNRRNELTWTLLLKPGEDRTVAYSYSVLVPH